MTNTPKSFWNEKWHRIALPDGLHYEVSNYGRLKSFSRGNRDGKIIDGSVVMGYRTLNVRPSKGKAVTLYVHKLVAEYFVEKPSPDHKYVIHLDNEKQSNYYENLKWVTKPEMVENSKTHPGILGRNLAGIRNNYKLTESKVRIIKKLVRNDNTRLTMIAKQFGISHTQLNRIRSGVNWKNVTIE